MKLRSIHRRSLPSPVRQRGAAAVFVAVALVALLTAVLLAINIGQLYYAQRDLQKQAALAALAGVTVGSGCGNGGVPGTLAEVTAKVTQSLNANKNTLTPATLTGINGAQPVELGWVNDSNGQTLTDDSNNTYTLPSDGKRHFIPLAEGDSHINAVRVNVSGSSVQIPFFGGFAPKTLYASATAEQPALGSFYLGSTLASLSGGALNGLLQGLFCPVSNASCTAGINLFLASYQGLAGVQVSLGQLATAVGVSSQDLSKLLSVQTTLPGILNGLSPLLQGTGTVSSATVATILQDLASGYTGNPQPVALGSIISAVDQVAADVPFIDLRDLIIALGEAANADPSGSVTPIALPIDLSIPGIATVDSFLQVLEPAQFSGWAPAGVAKAGTAQVKLKVRIEAGAILNGLSTTITNLVNGLLGVLSILGVHTTVTIAPPPINIGIDLALAPATAQLDKLTCPSTDQTSPHPTASLSANPAIAEVGIGTFSGSAASAPPLNTGLTSWPLADVNIDATHTGLLGLVNLGQTDLQLGLALTSAVVGGGSQSLTDVTEFYPPTGTPPTYVAYGIPPAASVLDNPQDVSSPISVNLNLGLTSTQTGSGLTGALTGLVNSLLNSLTTTVLNPLLGLVNGLASSLIDPLLDLLGVHLGVATVIMNGVVIDQPHVVTTALPGT